MPDATILRRRYCHRFSICAPYRHVADVFTLSFDTRLYSRRQAPVARRFVALLIRYARRLFRALRLLAASPSPRLAAEMPRFVSLHIDTICCRRVPDHRHLSAPCGALQKEERDTQRRMHARRCPRRQRHISLPAPRQTVPCQPSLSPQRQTPSSLKRCFIIE